MAIALCGVLSPGGILCAWEPFHGGSHSWEQRDRIQSLLARQVVVTVTGPTSEWTGHIIAISDDPTILLRTLGGETVYLPQAFEVKEVPGHPQSIAEAIDHMKEAERAVRPGSQPLPLNQQSDVPVSHNMVIKDLLSRPVTWDLSYGKAAGIRDQVASDLLSRLELGIARYGEPLRPNNGRDTLRDLYEELLDATAYARTRLLELGEDTLEWMILARVYDDLLGDAVEVRRLRNVMKAATE